jgi:hypothetical protein
MYLNFGNFMGGGREEVRVPPFKSTSELFQLVYNA